MPDIDLEEALTELINKAVSDEGDRVAEILGVGPNDKGHTVGLYRTQSGRQLGFEVSDGKIEVFEVNS
jgi:hypothetical protein